MRRLVLAPTIAALLLSGLFPFPAQARQLLEKYEGTVHLLVSETTHKDEKFIRTSQGDVLRIPEEIANSAEVGTYVVGVATNGQAQTINYEKSLVLPTGSDGRIVRKYRIVRFTSPDSTNDSVVSVDKVRRYVMSDSQTFVDRNLPSTVRFEVTGISNLTLTVSACNNEGKAWAQAKEVLSLPDDEAVMLVGRTNCGYSGRATLAGINLYGDVILNMPDPESKSWAVDFYEKQNISTVIHELGHNLGFSHANMERCPAGFLSGASSCGVIEYGVAFDVMGAAKDARYPLLGAYQAWSGAAGKGWRHVGAESGSAYLIDTNDEPMRPDSEVAEVRDGMPVARHVQLATSAGEMFLEVRTAGDGVRRLYVFGTRCEGTGCPTRQPFLLDLTSTDDWYPGLASGQTATVRGVELSSQATSNGLLVTWKKAQAYQQIPALKAQDTTDQATAFTIEEVPSATALWVRYRAPNAPWLTTKSTSTKNSVLGMAGLLPNTDYTFSYAIEDAAGLGNWSSARTIKTSQAYSDSLTRSLTNVSVNWRSASDSRLVEVQYQARVPNGTWPDAFYYGSEPSISFGQVWEGKAWRRVVSGEKLDIRWRFAVGSSYGSWKTTTTSTIAAPGAPSLSVKPGVSTLSVSVTPASDDAKPLVSYRTVEYRESGSTSWFSRSLYKDEESIKITGLKPDTAYELRAKARAESVDSAWSQNAFFKTQLVPSGPTATLISVADGEAKFTTNLAGIEDPEQFQVEWQSRRSTQKDWEEESEWLLNEEFALFFVPGATYVIRGRLMVDQYTGEWGPETTVSIPADAPRFLRATTTVGNVSLSWSKPVSAEKPMMMVIEASKGSTTRKVVLPGTATKGQIKLTKGTWKISVRANHLQTQGKPATLTVRVP